MTSSRTDWAAEPGAVRPLPEFDASLLSPDPILAAIDNYRGLLIDLDHDLRIDARALARGRMEMARALATSGVARGSRVVLAVGNGPLFVAALAALLELGAAPLLVHYQLPAAELKRTAQRYGAALVLVENAQRDELALIGPRFVIMERPWLAWALVEIDTAQPAFSSEFPTLEGVPLHPTSGSTGVPKIAVRPGPAAIAEALNYIGATGIDGRDTLLTVTPMSHAYAYGMGLMVPLISGATLLSVRRFTLKKVIDVLAHADVSVFPAVPAMLDMLLFGKGGDLLARPRLVLSAGAPLTRRTCEMFSQVTSRFIAPLYGTTETGGITVGPAGVPSESAASVGPPMAAVDVRILPPGEDGWSEGLGRVAVRSTSMMLGYLSPGGIDTTPLDDGWFLTGDLGRIDSAGHVELRGRTTDVINVSASKVVPSEVEKVLAEFPGVIECKVYAGERRAQSQFVKAAIVAEPSFDLAALRAFCAEQLVYYKRPEVIVRLDALPRSASGKIIKDQLP